MKLGQDVKIYAFANLYGCEVGDESKIGAFVEIQKNATTESGGLRTEADWKCIPTLVKCGSSIGSNATILCGVTIGQDAIVGAGSVVTHDVAPGTIVAGNPARVVQHAESLVEA